jgi:hypothetical protein
MNKNGVSKAKLSQLSLNGKLSDSILRTELLFMLGESSNAFNQNKPLYVSRKLK